MMLRSFTFTLVLLAALPSGAALAATARVDLGGVWVNPKGTVAVETQPCEGKLCGRIVWLSDKAMADAKESGVDHPIGTELLKDYRPAGDGSWQGMLYVPDMGRSFHSTIVALAPDRLKISGCLIGKYICKSQIWRRR